MLLYSKFIYSENFVTTVLPFIVLILVVYLFIKYIFSTLPLKRLVLYTSMATFVTPLIYLFVARIIFKSHDGLPIDLVISDFLMAIVTGLIYAFLSGLTAWITAKYIAHNNI